MLWVKSPFLPDGARGKEVAMAGGAARSRLPVLWPQTAADGAAMADHR